jgi:hypothetical protein
MHTAARPYVAVGAALAVASAVAITPVAPQPPETPLVNQVMRLTADGDSLLNVPLNLFQDFFNAPYNEIQALDTLAQSLLFSGPWLVGSPTNIWGEDPGDPGHFEAMTQLLLPFPELSGYDELQEGVPIWEAEGLGQQLSMMANVQIPLDATCSSFDCIPVQPTSPITGLTWLDQSLWSSLIGSGLQKFPLIQDWFQVPFSQFTGGNQWYFDPTNPDYSDPDGAVDDGFLWQGTHHPTDADLAAHPDLDPETNLLPWAGENWTMDLSAPFTNYFDSLQEPFDPSNFQLPDLVDFGRDMQSLLAAFAIAFNIFIPGSPFCPGDCVLPGDNPAPEGHQGLLPGTEGLPSYYVIIDALNKLWPGNPVLEEWLQDYTDGTANVSTPEIIDNEAYIWRLQGTLFDFGNFDDQLPHPGSPSVDLAIDASNYLPSMDQLHDLLGDYWFNIADNIGVLGPFDFDGLMDALAGAV